MKPKLHVLTPVVSVPRAGWSSQLRDPNKLAVTDSGSETHHIRLLAKLLRRLGELVLQQKRVHAFEKITGHRALRRHLQHAGEEVNADVGRARVLAHTSDAVLFSVVCVIELIVSNNTDWIQNTITTSRPLSLVFE